MTAYELSDLIASGNANQVMIFTVFLTIVSAYLACAFVAGKKLNGIQVAILNGVFVLAVASNGLSMFRATQRATELTDEAVRREIIGFPVQSTSASATAAFYTLVVLVSLVFMWSSRRPTDP
jgi:hypothetical protein